MICLNLYTNQKLKMIKYWFQICSTGERERFSKLMYILYVSLLSVIGSRHLTNFKKNIVCNWLICTQHVNFGLHHCKNSVHLAFQMAHVLQLILTKLDGNVALEFVLEPDSLHTRQSFHDSWLSMSYVADGSNVNSSLLWDYFGRDCRQLQKVLQSWKIQIS